MLNWIVSLISPEVLDAPSPLLPQPLLIPASRVLLPRRAQPAPWGQSAPEPWHSAQYLRCPEHTHRTSYPHFRQNRKGTVQYREKEAFWEQIQMDVTIWEGLWDLCPLDWEQKPFINHCQLGEWIQWLDKMGNYWQKCNSHRPDKMIPLLLSLLCLYSSPSPPVGKGFQAQQLVMVSIQVLVNIIKYTGSCYKSYYHLWTNSDHLKGADTNSHLCPSSVCFNRNTLCQSNDGMVRTELLPWCPSLFTVHPARGTFSFHFAQSGSLHWPHTKKYLGFLQTFLNWKIMLCLFCPLNRLKDKPLSREPQIPTLVKGWCYLQSNGVIGGTLWVGSWTAYRVKAELLGASVLESAANHSCSSSQGE